MVHLQVALHACLHSLVTEGKDRNSNILDAPETDEVAEFN